MKVVLEQYHLAQERRRVHESRYANSIIPQAEWGTYPGAKILLPVAGLVTT